ncbi:MAG: ZIP family metal transporter, partial [Candidatus Aenigmatarchaeota archaeon]
TMLEIFIVSLLAGLATALGGLIVIYFKNISQRATGMGLGFSAGVMIVIAFMSLFYKALEMGAYATAVISFMAGAVVMMLFDFLIPHRHFGGRGRRRGHGHTRMMKLGFLVALGMAMHNFPEGAIIGVGYTVLPTFGIILALAIAIHNIPEGIAVAVPLKAAGMKGSKIFKITLFSGLTEPIGALIAALFLVTIPGVLPVALGFTGGVMVYLSIDELIPVAKAQCKQTRAISIGIILGMALALILEAFV